MTIANALKGTRMGRPVKSEAQVLEEFRDYKAPEETKVEVPAPAATAPSGSGDPGSLESSIDPMLNPGIVGSGTIESRIERLSNGAFQFFNIPYQGRVLRCVERKMQYLYGGDVQPQNVFLEWLADQSFNTEGYTLADMELEYQMRRIAFDLRNDKKYGAAARQYILELQTTCSSFILTASYIQYGVGVPAIITSMSSIPSKQKMVQIPMYTDSHFLLSKERVDSRLDKVLPIDAATQAFLKEILGEGFERAGMVLPYCASRISGNLRETLLTTFSGDLTANPERVGGMGPDLLGRFDLSVDVERGAAILPVIYRF